MLSHSQGAKVALRCGQFVAFKLTTDGNGIAEIKSIEYDPEQDCMVLRVRFECVDHVGEAK